MADFAWLVRRLKAMSAPEVAWRISQKAIQKSEENRFKSRKIAVTEILFNEKLSALQLDADRMHLNWDNKTFSLGTEIPLLGGYHYETYKKRWNAGFQTENNWPEQFSYGMEYKQRDDIGDARTNWELNRHFQFALLAKVYYVSGDKKVLLEFENLFNDWNQKNPFLWGISWTSVMDIAIRCSNWCYAWCFLKKAGAPDKLSVQLQTGILNMTDYIARHYSRYSSANNHLIVEAYAIGQTGVLCDYKPWIDLAVNILTRELPLQNYSDGVNKELSLHYQSFYMEAMGLMMRLLVKNKISVPKNWKPTLKKMCSYMADCMGDYGEMMVFGDDDEGKILDLQGGFNHYQYVLGLFSFLLDEQYINLHKVGNENLNWLFSTEDCNIALSKSLYQVPLDACYKCGGNTILRSRDHRILIGIDHAALGFGTIAAHGHADALSFQMYVNGLPVFIDPGTYIYHCDIESRNAYRKTENHNTVCINGRDQSEMLGAFLWGKRAESQLISHSNAQGKIELTASHDGYSPAKHIRKYEFDGESVLTITDRVENLNSGDKIQINYILAPECQMKIAGNIISVYDRDIKLKMIVDSSNARIWTEDVQCSVKYGEQQCTKKIVVGTPTGIAVVKIIVE